MPTARPVLPRHFRARRDFPAGLGREVSTSENRPGAGTCTFVYYSAAAAAAPEERGPAVGSRRPGLSLLTKSECALTRLHSPEAALVDGAEQFLGRRGVDRRRRETDATALDVADRAIERGFDRQVEPALRGFFYLPFEHSESLADQERSVALHEAAGDEDGLTWARHHYDIIARFGRFPHRNAILGRASTPEELAYLAQEDAFKG